MAHLLPSKTRAEATPAEWLPLAAQIADQCNTWAERHDIVGYVGTGAGSGAPACFKPAIAEMEVNVELAFGEGTNPAWVSDFTNRRTHFDYPIAAGAVLHEAAHARWSLWPLEAVFKHPNRQVATIAELFEETRIEALARKTFPRNRAFLRACALKLVLGDLDTDEVKDRGAFGLSTLFLLSLARVDARVLEASDVAPIQAIGDATFGHELMRTLRKLWLKAQAHDVHTDAEPLIKLAEEWVAALVESGAMSEDEANAEGSGAGRPGKGEKGEGEGEGEGPSSEMSEAIAKAIAEALEALEEAAAEVEVSAAAEAAAQEVAEHREAEVASRAEAASEQEAHAKESAKIFAKGTGPDPSSGTGSRLSNKRPPTSEERVAAVTVAKLLEKARYQDRVITPVKRSLPPGRLNTRAAVQGVADISRVGMTDATPWRAKARKHTEDPELKMGVLVDISGSMGAAMLPMATTAWVFSEAARRIQAKCAMTYYGTGVFPVLKPGQHLSEVNIYTAPDGTEKFNSAFKATDGALNLLHGSGARLLVICSDMVYTGPETAAALKWVQRCVAAGVAVLIMPFDNSGYYDRELKRYEKAGAVIVKGVHSAADTATIVGRAAAEALEKASARRAG